MHKTSHDSETPAHGQQVMSACAFIHDEKDGEPVLFLAKRADTKKFLPGMYEFPGGHIDYGEDLTLGLAREIREEFDVSVSIGDPFAAFTYENPVKVSHIIEVVYFARLADPIEKIVLNPEDHSTWEWFTEGDVRSRTKDLIPESGITTYTPGSDPEYEAILRGFALLKGKRLHFG
ncbi:NUDIX domain-containing protein [Patescibacteria group bacterium]|jgi:8-oxo-dGTP diphosphatase|nr:NUDIX domain-containing protein [Patescibacteria group bacterium]